MTFVSASLPPSFAVHPAAQLAAAVVFGAAGMALLLPRPRGRKIAFGVFLCLAALVLTLGFIVSAFATPGPDRIGQALFWFFSAGAVGFGTLLVAQRNPARGAIAFAFVVLSTCGLFLLLAAPFLMAATVIVYAGAIVVTFLFVLMLSQTGGPSDENDRSREPLLGSLAGFAFTGLVLFALYLGSPFAVGENGEPSFGALLPTPPLTPLDRAALLDAARELELAAATADPKGLEGHARAARDRLTEVVGFAAGEPRGGPVPRSIQDRLQYAERDARTHSVIRQADAVRDRKKATFDRLENAILDPKPQLDPVRRDLRALREEVILLAGRGDLPARNVSAVGLTLYSDHLLAVEMAGTLLLVATIGAVAIARRREPT